MNAFIIIDMVNCNIIGVMLTDKQIEDIFTKKKHVHQEVYDDFEYVSEDEELVMA